MYIARVTGKVISSVKIPAYEGRVLLFVQKLGLDMKAQGLPTIAVDYVGAGEGDLVMVGAAPGLASAVFQIPDAPIRELVMGIVDYIDLCGSKESGRAFPPVS